MYEKRTLFVLFCKIFNNFRIFFSKQDVKKINLPSLLSSYYGLLK